MVKNIPKKETSSAVVVRTSSTSKIVAVVIVTALIVFAGSYVFFKYLPEQSRQHELNDYKKALYTSMVCQYDCPLSYQTANNRTQLLPEVVCVKRCTEAFRTSVSPNSTFTDTDLLNDNFVTDVKSVLDSCRTESIVGASVPTINNSAYFPCVVERLSDLKSTYTYLE